MQPRAPRAELLFEEVGVWELCRWQRRVLGPLSLAYSSFIQPMNMLRPHEVASVLNVSERRVRRWLLERRLRGTRAPFGQWRISAAEVERFVQSHGDAAVKQRWAEWRGRNPRAS